jgi:hypothetical protein
MIGIIYLLGILVFGTLTYVIGEFFEDKGNDFYNYGTDSLADKIGMCAGLSVFWPILVPGAIIVLAVLAMYNFFKYNSINCLKKINKNFFI